MTNREYYRNFKPDSMEGCTIGRKKCTHCKEYKAMLGSRRINNQFYCEGCAKELKL